jgi:phosphatidylglycerophosphatase A
MTNQEPKDTPLSEQVNKKTFLDIFSLAFATFGVGYLPLAPGTWGSAVAIGIYLLVRWAVWDSAVCLTACGWRTDSAGAWLGFSLIILFLIFTLVGIWAAGRAAKVLGVKDPGKVVVDELMGQFLVFFFVPLAISWWMILLGFLFFRVFDIWKPYPIDNLQDLPGGLGICADDIVAGAYAGICLTLIYAVSLSL